MARDIDSAADNLTVRPIGRIHTGAGRSTIRVEAEWGAGLRELDGFSHVMIIWWFDGTDNTEGRSVTLFDPPFPAPTLGVFASRAPVRPNPIALSTTRLLGVNEAAGAIEVAPVDADDGSPVLDIKPYMPHYDRVRDPSVPEWASTWPEWIPEEGLTPGEMASE